MVKSVSTGWGKCSHTTLLDNYPAAPTCWRDTIAIGLQSSSIIILNAITGLQMAILSGHTGSVQSLVFSSDGTLLVSGSGDNTIKLWDMQTGGVVKTFQGHTGWVFFVSISADCTTIASGSLDETICLWDIQTGECYHIIEQEDIVDYICFFPSDPKHIIYTSGGKIWQWDIGGQQITSVYNGSHTAFSLDGTQFVVCNGSAVEVKSSGSRVIVAKFRMAYENISCCCFSPDNRVVAVAAGSTIYIWDISSSNPHLLEAFIGHTGSITSLVFSSPSSLISASMDCSVKFWQIGTSSTDPVLADLKSMSPASASIKSITLQTNNGIAISSHLDGMVRIWDIQTGICKAYFQTPAKDSYQMDTKLTDGKLVSVWCTYKKICVWDTEKGDLIREVAVDRDDVEDLRISEDGSKVFCLYMHTIQAWSVQTGEVVGEVMHGLILPTDPLLTIDGPRVWVHPPSSPELIFGWDFGVSGSSPVKLSNLSWNGPHLDFVGGIRDQRSFLPAVQDTVTGKVVFQLPGRLARPSDAQWDGQYLVAGYDSGEVLILECNLVLH